MQTCNLYLKKVVCLLSIFLLYGWSLHAQEIDVKGTITDINGDPLAGASILIKGTSRGEMADINGSYSIRVPNSQSILIFSYIGYNPIEIVVGNRKNIDVQFSDNTNMLDDVVVIGYGSVKKKDLTGSVSAINEKDFQKGGATADRLIMGKVGGVQVTPNGGAPGSGSRIRIRGGSSLTASNDPLIIVDGVPLENSGVAGSPSLLSTINPNDIESMNILKDASAAAIYGSRAANGVIIVTTKQAKYGQKIKIDFDTRLSISSIQKKMDVLSASQITDIVTNSPYSSDEYRNMLGTANTDWQDEIYKNAFGTDNNLSVSGATKNMPYRISLGYLNEDGILKTGNMERISGSVNLSPRFFDEKLRVDINLKGSRVNNQFANTGAISGANSFDPTKPVKADGFDDYRGYYTWLLKDGSLNTQASTNPVMMLDTYKNKAHVLRGIASAQVDYRMHFLPELRANLNVAYDYSKGEGDTYTPAWVPYMVSRGGQRMEYGDKKTNRLMEFYLNYAKEFESIQSHIDVMVGHSYQDWVTDKDNYIDYTEDGREHSVPVYFHEEERNKLESYFGRLNYNFMDRYLFTATFRRDGSSRFGEDYRWGNFPSFALAWKVNEEDFLKNVSSISDLKLRLGYGVTGQQDIYENYGYIKRYTQSGNSNMYQFGNEYYYMYRPEKSDPERKWESTATYNVAIDYGFLDNRISGSVDFYLKKTKDLLNNISIPAGSNFSNTLITNIGNMENKGVEFNLNLNPIRTKDWNWDVNFNIGYNKNKITKLTMVDTAEYEGVADGWISGSTGTTVQIHSVGYNKYAFYLFKQVYDETGKPLEGVYADLNNDGKINNDDLYRTKSAEPKLTGGFSTTLSYKDWTLSTTLRGSYDNYVYNNVASNYANYVTIFSSSGSIVNAPTSVLKSNFVQRQPQSDYYLENASFIKMDNLSLSYNFGNILNNVLGLRATFNVQNVFTITKYTGIDPEIAGGIDRDFYPRPRIFSLGFNLSF